jgi:hypothetical protein
VADKPTEQGDGSSRSFRAKVEHPRRKKSTARGAGDGGMDKSRQALLVLLSSKMVVTNDRPCCS